MLRLAVACASALLLLGSVERVQAQPDLSGPPIMYEVLINGENFRVEGNRTVKVQSTKKPGATYEIAIGISPTQRCRLNTVEFDYDLPATITDDRSRFQRTVRLKHEIVFSMLITDIGEALDAKDQEEALKILTDSLEATYREQKGAELEVSKPADFKFESGPARKTKIHYKDDKDFGHTCWAFVLSMPKATVTCVAQYLDEDEKEAAPLVKKTLDSLRPAP
jgi:hypothetical protein